MRSCAGFFGMNVPVPFAENTAAFNVIIVSCATAAGLIASRLWRVIGGRDMPHQRMEAAMASKRILSNIVAVEGALKTCGFRPAAGCPEFRRALEEALGQTITAADEERVRELLPLFTNPLPHPDERKGTVA